MSEITKEKVLTYHKQGKIGIDLTKSCDSQFELSLAYTPGVAIPCLEIAKDENLAFEYTNKANLVAVVSDGTAVLGLGDIGPLPFNKEALIWVASAVARTAVEEGVARVDNYDDEVYKEHLRSLIYGCPEDE
jgi:malic enzyme